MRISTARWQAAILVMMLLPFAAAQAQQSAPSIEKLRAGFLSPPPEARPMVRWWWFGPAVVKPEILRELQQMKANGIGGAELAFVYPEVLDDPAKDLKNLTFLSPEMLDDVHYAQAEGRRLGLRIDVTLCSGWPYGGPSITLDEAVTLLRTVEVVIPPNATAIQLPKFADGETLLSASVVEGEPKKWKAADAKPLPLQIPTDTTTLIVDPSVASRVVLVFIQSHTRQQVKRAAVGAEGYVLDPFSHDAVAKHLKNVGEPLLSAFGSTPPYAIFSDSLEAYGADWTPDLPQQFLKRRGYDLLPHLPELMAGGSLAADKVRHDYGRTLTELVDENYLEQINNWALAHHTRFRSQTYGVPAVSFSSQDFAGLPEGEGPQWRAFSTLRWASSANHVYGNNVTSGETFTWLHSPVFRATPLDMKAEADIDFIMGENQLVFHGWPYSPPDHEVPEPGWSLYAAASFNDHNPWWPVEASVNQYITRVSWLLRQGKPANQVAILLPTDDAWASFSPGHTSVTDAMKTLITQELMSTILSAGYNIDYIDADAINKVGLGDHQILIIPPTDRIPVSTLQSIYKWRMQHPDNGPTPLAHNYNVICYQRCPSIDPDGKPLPGMTGSYLIADDYPALVKDMNDVVRPDLQFDGDEASNHAAIGFIRRKLSDGDIYFIANTSNQSIHANLSFNTVYNLGARWNPETGQAVDRVMAGGNELNLAPYESAVFVFGKAVTPDSVPMAKPVTNQVVDLTTDWRLRFTALDKTVSEPTLTDWTADPATLHYSGEGVYSRDFTLGKLQTAPTYLEVDGGTTLAEPRKPGDPPVLLPNGLPDPRITRTGPGIHAYYDPPIHEAALVNINGKPAGALWHPPYRLDVTSLLKPGTNHIEIRVYNTALNAWSALPKHDYKPLIAKYGDRFQMQDLDKVMPVPSGILGTIHLVTEAK